MGCSTFVEYVKTLIVYDVKYIWEIWQRSNHIGLVIQRLIPTSEHGGTFTTTENNISHCWIYFYGLKKYRVVSELKDKSHLKFYRIFQGSS